MKELIAKILAKELKKKEEEIINLIETPPSSELGDFAFPCFSLAKEMRKNPVEIAKNLAGKIKPGKEIERVEVKGAYLNFFLNKSNFAEDIIPQILKEKEKFGQGKEKETMMIEFSQANTHKAFHVGHIRGTSIGESLSRISEFLGNKVIRANYQGDTGMHVAKWIWNYSKNHSKDKVKADEQWIASIYVDAIKRLAENENLQEEVDEINRKLEEGKDKKLMDLWKKTRKICLDALEIIYKELNTKFNKYYFESQVEKRGKEICIELAKKGIAKISEEATIMDLNEYGLSVWVLLRKDGTVLYSGKDLALVEKKFKENKMDKCLYVVADEQNLHFQQLFKTLELMGFKGREKCEHIHYGLVRLPTGKMSSRTGDNILYSSFKKEVLDFAKQEIKKRNSGIKEKELEGRALKISIASIKYAMLKQSPNKVIVFTKEDALDFEGNTGPYLLYSYARASSILKKSDKKPKLEKEQKDVDEKESLLIKKLGNFPEIVQQAHKQLNPSVIANYSFELAQIFNEFYHSSPVINSEKEEFRLALVQSFRIVMKSSLNLLGIDIVEEM